MSTTTKNDKSEEFFKKLKQIKTGYVTIGVHEDAGSYGDGTEVVKVALWNEFGTPDADYPIPERSFFRTAIDQNIDKINNWRDEMIDNIFEKGWSVEKALNAMGLRIQILVQNKIKSNVPPINAESTSASKKSRGVGQKTLMDSKLMLRSVTYKVHK
jgi:hypothetical protein